MPTRRLGTVVVAIVASVLAQQVTACSGSSDNCNGNERAFTHDFARGADAGTSPGVDPTNCNAVCRDLGLKTVGDSYAEVSKCAFSGGPAPTNVHCEYVEHVRCYSGGVQEGRRPAGLAPLQLAKNVSPLGALFAEMAYLEGASVAAFEILRDELAAYGAPEELLRAATDAARDEVRHYRIMSTFARRHGAQVPAPRPTRAPVRALEEIARENMVEGCVRETYGAAVAEWQAHAALDLSLRATMRQIARDEARHATLAWDIADWLATQLSLEANARIGGARDEALAALRAELTQEHSPEVLGASGLPSRESALRLFEELEAKVWRVTSKNAA